MLKAHLSILAGLTLALCACSSTPAVPGSSGLTSGTWTPGPASSIQVASVTGGHWTLA